MSKAKFHISIGHETVLAKLTLFGCATTGTHEEIDESNKIEQISTAMNRTSLGNIDESDANLFSFNQEYKVVPCISGDIEEEAAKCGADKAVFCLLEFERPVVIVPGCKGKCDNRASWEFLVSSVQ